VLPGGCALRYLLGVQMVGRADPYRVDVAIAQHFLHIAIAARQAVLLRELHAALGRAAGGPEE
jgi:hypothetical protein